MHKVFWFIYLFALFPEFKKFFFQIAENNRAFFVLFFSHNGRPLNHIRFETVYIHERKIHFLPDPFTYKMNSPRCDSMEDAINEYVL